MTGLSQHKELNKVIKITQMHEMSSVMPSLHGIAAGVDRFGAKISELLSPLALLALR